MKKIRLIINNDIKKSEKRDFLSRKSFNVF